MPRSERNFMAGFATFAYINPARCNVAVMSVTINLSSDELAQIKRLTELENENEAVTKAAREFLRVAQLRELKAASGKVDYQDVSDAMEALELRERHSKQ
jgi:Arc/MetJ family transcription regulator